MYKILIGTISAQRREDWFRKDEDPYGVWEGRALVETICTIGTWTIADEILRDRVDVDWGSIAWKGNLREIGALFRAAKLDISILHVLERESDYAVVFLETVWGDSA